MSISSFILQLLGKSPEQKEAEEQFQASLKKYDESDENLDGILGDLKRLNNKAQKNREFTKTLFPGEVTTGTVPKPDN